MTTRSRHTRRLTVAAVTSASALALTGCASTVSTAPDQVALHYSKGATSGQKFEGCVAASTYASHGFGDLHYAYPTNQRTFDASNAQGAEAKPVTVVSKDGQEMSWESSVTFTLRTDCDTLKAFHEKLGARYGAFWADDETPPEGPKGWVTLLQFVFGKSLDTALDREAQKYDWKSLWNDPATKAEVERNVIGALQTLVDQQSANQNFFKVDVVRVQKPDPTNQSLKANISAAQAEVAKAQTAEAQAKAQKAAAEAQVAVAKAQAAQVAEQIKVLGKDGYLETIREANRKAAIDKGLNPYPPTIVPGSGR